MTMARNKVCPNCGRKYPGNAKICSKDQARLIDLIEAEPSASKAVAAVADSSDPLVGMVLGERYDIKKRLGEGGMGAVYEGWDRSLRRRVAIKVILDKMLAQFAWTPEQREEYRLRFLREARAAAKLAHPNVIVLYDQGETLVPADKTGRSTKLPFIVMEFLDGETLGQRVLRGPLPGWQTVAIGLQIAQALAHAHKAGIWHRDIKLDNVFLVDRDGHPDFVKVVDFGLARILSEEALTKRPDQISGTPSYLAPECWMQALTNDTKSDLYALGVALYELLTGGINPFADWLSAKARGKALQDIPFHSWGLAHSQHVPTRVSEQRSCGPIPPALDELIAALLAKDPDLRPTAEDAAAQLQQIQRSLPSRSLGSMLLLKTQAGATMPVATAATDPAPTMRTTGNEPRTLLMPRQGAQLHTDSTVPISQARLFQMEAAARELDVVEPQMEESSRLIDTVASELIARRWKQLPPPEVTRHQERVLSIESQRRKSAELLSAAEQKWHEDSARVDRERAAAQSELWKLQNGPDVTPDARAAKPSALLQKELDLEWKRDAIRADSMLIESVFGARRQLHSHTYAFHHAILLKGDAVVAEWEKDPGLLSRLGRAEPALIRLKQELPALRLLLERTRRIWEVFPILRPEETVRTPPHSPASGDNPKPLSPSKPKSPES